MRNNEQAHGNSAKQFMIKRVVLRRERFGGIVGDRNGYGFYPVNAAAFDFLKRTRSGNTVLELGTDHIRLLDRLSALGYLDAHGRFAGEIVDNGNDVPFMSAPIRVWIEVTSKCNLRCRECINELHPNLKTELSLAAIQHVLSDLSRSGVLQITITGGEPLLRRDIWKVLDKCFDLGFGVRFFTNATTLTFENTRRLIDYPFSHVFASVDGIGDINDRLRGVGTFDRIAKGISRLADSIENLTLSVTVHRYGISQLPEMFAFAKQNRVRSLLIRPVFNYTRRSDDPISIPRSQVRELLEALESASKESGVEYQINKLPFVEQRKSVYLFDSSVDIHASAFSEYNQFGCVGGNTVVGIKSNGTIAACGFLPIRYSECGNNVSQTRFLDLWNESANVRVLRDIPANSKCKECGLLSICGGGCRANAMTHLGAIDSVDPYCFWTEKPAPQVPDYRAEIERDAPTISTRRIITKCGSGSNL